MRRNKTRRPATPAAETEFERRRIGEAILHGDLQTALALAGEGGTEGVAWAFLLVGVVGALDRSLKLTRVARVAAEAYGDPPYILEPAAEPGSHRTVIGLTVQTFILSGQMSRIRRMAERIATTPTDDTLARAVLSCRLDDVHLMTATHRLRTKHQSKPRPIRTVPLQSHELAESSQNDEQEHELSEGYRQIRDWYAEVALDELASYAASGGTSYQVDVRPDGRFKYCIEAVGLNARHAANEARPTDRHPIAQAAEAGLTALFEAARLRPFDTLGEPGTREETADQKRTVRIVVANPALQGFLKATARSASTTPAEILRTATEAGLLHRQEKQANARREQRADTIMHGPTVPPLPGPAGRVPSDDT